MTNYQGNANYINNAIAFKPIRMAIIQIKKDKKHW